MMDISELIGKTLKEATGKVGEAEIRFETVSGERFALLHIQDCCEFVYVEDICGDLESLVGSPILTARETTNSNLPAPMSGVESYTWTFYDIATVQGHVTIRFFGASNGYYSEEAELVKVE